MRVLFQPAYVHKNLGRPAVDPGQVFVLDVQFQIEGDQIEGDVGALPTWIYSGALHVGGAVLDGLVPLPFEASGAIILILFVAPDNRRLTVSGSGVSVRAIGRRSTWRTMSRCAGLGKAEG